MLSVLNPKTWRPTLIAAGLLVLVAAGGVVAYKHHWLRVWMPNVVVGALTVAITITLVDAAIRAEARRRGRPRLDDALHAIGYPFKGLFLALAYDYGQTHSEVLELPDGPLDLLDFWGAQEKSRDRDRQLVAGSGPTMLIDAATRLGETLTEHRDRDHDVFGMELLRTTDRFIEAAENTAALPAFIAANVFPDPQSQLAQAHEQIVVAARALCAEYVKERPGWSPVDDFVRGASVAANASEE